MGFFPTFFCILTPPLYLNDVSDNRVPRGYSKTLKLNVDNYFHSYPNCPPNNVTVMRISLSCDKGANYCMEY